jgi:F420-0:gamma-glutamyl ligase
MEHYIYLISNALKFWDFIIKEIERLEKIDIQEKQTFDLKQKLKDSSAEIERLKSNTNTEPEETTQNRTQRVTTHVLTKILKSAGIDENNADKTQIANLISHLTGYSSNTIRQELTNPKELTKTHKAEIENVNQILKKLKTNISITYQ